MSMEAILIIPAFLLFLALIAAIGRTALIRDDLQAAAVSSSRGVSLQSTAQKGEQVGRQVVHEHLLSTHYSCQRLIIEIDATALNLPAGRHGEVSVTLTCSVPLGDLGVPGLPGFVTLKESFTTPIDPYTLR
jgi:hypothetical protein